MRKDKVVDANHPVICGLGWILEHRTRPDGRRMTRAYLSQLAGLDRKYVSQILRGQRTPYISAKTSDELARAANVRTSWLLTGREPREPHVEHDPLLEVFGPDGPDLAAADPYPTRQRVIASARNRKIEKAAIRAVLTEWHHRSDPGEDYWRDRLREQILYDYEYNRRFKSTE